MKETLTVPTLTSADFPPAVRAYWDSAPAQFKVPAKICFTDEIPLTENSKVDKKYIRELLQKNSK